MTFPLRPMRAGLAGYSKTLVDGGLYAPPTRKYRVVVPVEACPARNLSPGYRAGGAALRSE